MTKTRRTVEKKEGALEIYRRLIKKWAPEENMPVFEKKAATLKKRGGIMMSIHAARLTQINYVMDEAKRFLNKAYICKLRLKQDPSIYATKESGAMKRASLDLSEALIKLRKPHP